MSRAESGEESGMMRPDALFVRPPQNDAPLSQCNWYHVMDVPGLDAPTPGQWDLRGRFAEYVGHVDLAGRSVLDIGAASGFLSFSAEQAGAREVVSFDIDIGDRQNLLPFKDSLYFRDHATWARENTAHFDLWKNAYWLAHRAYLSSARVVYGDIYNLPPALGGFDVIIFCAVLEHMADPIRAIASVSRHATDRMILGVWIPDHTVQSHIAWFLGSADRPGDNAVFWAYSIPVYREILGMLGFEIEAMVTGEFRLSDGRTYPRTAIVAKRRS
jgi:SAM-dependent methyltransferase